MSRLVVISNRMVVPDEQGGPAPGGLAVAVNAALERRRGLWFGWSGRVLERPGKPRVLERGQVDYVQCDLQSEDFHAYYNGFANRVLWPILHYRVDLAEFNEADFDGYRRVNEYFADHLSPMLQPDDLVWVHDYHLIPLAEALRKRAHLNPIGFFLHIPMPPPDLLTALPHHEQLVRALTHFDLIGFQTENDAANFARYLTSVLGAATRDGRRYRFGERHFRVGVFPVGVDTEGFSRLARESVGSAFHAELAGSLVGRALMLGVDRLDYSKGIINRIDAFERFLENNPDWHGRVTYLQIAPGTRSEIPEYMEIDEAVSARVGHINGRFGDVAWVPLRYVSRTHARAEVAAMMRIARVALVTPLRDGMNLIAKEFVVAQDPEDPGVLVLSRFAGAAAELEAALLVNPHDRDALAAAIRQALTMPLAERQARHAEMLSVLEANRIHLWGQSFLAALTRPGRVLNWLSERVVHG